MKRQIISRDKTFFFSLLFFCFEPLTAQEAINTDTSQQAITEIQVKGRPPLGPLREQISLAQDRAFNLFNELNDDDEFDIECAMRTSPGTNIKTKQCAANFYMEAQRQMTQEFLNNAISNFSSGAQDVNLVVAHKNPILREKMTTLAAENPELQARLDEYYELGEELKEVIETYYRNED